MSGRDTPIGVDLFDQQLARLVVATADAPATDAAIDRSVADVLRLVREHLEMDVVFVSRLEQGQRIFRQVEPDDGQQVIAAGGADPIELSFCQRVLDGRLPQLIKDVRRLPNFGELPPTAFPIGAHLSTPIVLACGRIYGTLCCFSFAPNEALTERDLKRLRMAAGLTARLIDQSQARAREAC